MKKTPSLHLSQAALHRLATQHHVTAAGLHVIKRVRTSPPNRRTKGHRCVRGSYPSKKMGVTIQFESHRGELPAILNFEHDHLIFEFYDQPSPSVKLTYLDKNGRPTGCLHTPDWFVIGAEFIGWIESKTEQDLRDLAKEMPNRYVRQADGSWRCPPGEAYAAQFGLGYRILVSDRLSSELTRNLLFLEDYYLRDYPAPTNKAVAKVLEVVRDDQGITYPALLAKVKGQGLTADDLNYLISRGTIFTDLRSVLLIDPESVTIFTDRVIAGAAQATAQAKAQPVSGSIGPVNLIPTAKIRWHGEEHIITHADAVEVHLLRADGKNTLLKRTDLELDICAGQVVGISSDHAREQVVVNLITQAGPEKLREAVTRWQTIQPILEDPSRMKGVSKRRRRTINRWLAAYRRELQGLGNGFVGLLPEDRPGYHRSHLSDAVETLMTQFIVEHYETNTNPTIGHVHGLLLAACESLGLTPPSLKTFGKRVRERPQYGQTRKRKGARAAMQRAKFYYFLDQKTPVHGDRPFEIGHIDHTELDVEVVCPRTGKNLGRPWLTTLMDARTRRVLAIHVSLFSESSESCMMVMRECVRRHHRLPQTLVVDNGKAFNSLYFEALLAAFYITKKSRPAAHPRFGSVCERLFGTINTQFIHNLRGNTKLMKNVRQVTKSVDPKNLAAWTLEELTDRLQFFCYEVYDTNDHSALGRSPRAEMTGILEPTGNRQHTFIPYDWLFQILTLPTTKHGVAKVHCQKGVHVNYLDYWNDAFDDAKVEGTEVPVRFDPWDASVAYAFVGGEWVTCISSHANVFKKWSQRAVAMATDQLRAQHRADGKNKTINSLRLAKFMEEVKEQEEFLLLRAKEAASRGDAQLVDKSAGTPAGDGKNTPPDAPADDSNAPKGPFGFDNPEGATSDFETETE